MEKIKLSKEQVELIESYINHEFNQFTATEQQQIAFMEIIDMAEELEESMGADSGDDLILWFWNKVNEK